jgi:glutamate racemase
VRRTAHHKQRKSVLRHAAAVLVLVLISTSVSCAQASVRAGIANLFGGDSVTILITDSGLGGLSVCADLEASLSSQKSLGAVKLVFANALADPASPYNAMTEKAQQLRVFDGALSGMKRWYHPDAILIACNTLSALYPETSSASKEDIPVVSIIDVGSKMIAERAKESGSPQIVVLGTPTTIASGIYDTQLVSFGIPQDRIISQSCRLLETEIQADPQSDLVQSLVETYVDEAMERIDVKRAGTITVGLCCSHYGYSVDAFRRALRQKVGDRFELVNPNKAMVALFASANRVGGGKPTEISVQVVSRVAFTAQEIRSIAGAVYGTSPKTAEALKRYEYKKDLFPFMK